MKLKQFTLALYSCLSLLDSKDDAKLDEGSIPE